MQRQQAETVTQTLIQGLTAASMWVHLSLELQAGQNLLPQQLAQPPDQDVMHCCNSRGQPCTYISSVITFAAALSDVSLVAGPSDGAI